MRDFANSKTLFCQKSFSRAKIITATYSVSDFIYFKTYRHFMQDEIEREIDRAYVAGFAMGEGCFHINITSRKGGKKSRLYYSIRPMFAIRQAEQDLPVLDYVQKIIGFGSIHKSSYSDNKNANVSAILMISGAKRCKKLIPFFDKYKLHGQKQVDYELWKDIIRLMDTGAHLTVDGFLKIAEIRDKMNLRGLNGKPNPRYRDATFFRNFFKENQNILGKTKRCI